MVEFPQFYRVASILDGPRLCPKMGVLEGLNMRLQRLLLVSSLLTVLTGSIIARESPSEIIQIIERPQEPNRQGLDPFTIPEIMEEYGIPGASIAVIENFEVHWARSYGVADVKTGARVAPETLFQAASISKPVAAMAVLKAVQEGKFSLEDDINTILESWKVPENELTSARPVTPQRLGPHRHDEKLL